MVTSFKLSESFGTASPMSLEKKRTQRRRRTLGKRAGVTAGIVVELRDRVAYINVSSIALKHERYCCSKFAEWPLRRMRVYRTEIKCAQCGRLRRKKDRVSKIPTRHEQPLKLNLKDELEWVGVWQSKRSRWKLTENRKRAKFMMAFPPALRFITAGYGGVAAIKRTDVVSLCFI